MMTIYNWADSWIPGEFPCVLAIGDSWFWYPKANNLLDALARHPRLNNDYRNMVRLGKNGALLVDYVDLPGREGQFSKQLKRQLDPKTLQYFSVFLVSGAGNDAVDYSLALKPDCSNVADAADSFDKDGTSNLLKLISQALGLLLHEVIWAFSQLGRTPLIFLHAYDYPVPDGRGFTLLPGMVTAGPWLKPAMDKCKVPHDMILRRQIAHMLIDQLAGIFAPYQSPKSGIYLVDSRGTLSTRDADYRRDWDNELHPTSAGFDAIVNQHWIPVFQHLGLTK